MMLGRLKTHVEKYRWAYGILLATIAFVAQSIFQPEIVSFAQDKKCAWLVDCESQKSLAFVNSLRLGVKISSVKAAEEIPYEEGSFEEIGFRNYCNEKMYARVYLDRASRIVGVFVISKSVAFRPTVPKSEFYLGQRISEFKDSSEIGEELISKFRHSSGFYLREVIIPERASNWKQVVVGYYPLGHTFGSADLATFIKLFANPALHLPPSKEAYARAREIHANAFGIARPRMFLERNIVPEWLGGDEFREFDCD